MFSHLFKYSFRSLLRFKETLIWSFIFPFALSTFMFMAFGDINKVTESFHVVPVAVVQLEENEIFEEMIETVSAEGDSQLIEVKTTDKDEAEKMLQDETVKGILYVGEDVSLKVSSNGIDQSVLQVMTDQFMQYKRTITDVAVMNPDKIQNAITALTEEVQCISEQKATSGNQDNLTNYFYAIFAMTCLFASYAGCEKIMKLQADVSTLGQRRNVAPTHKMKTILVEFLSCELFQYTTICLLFLYMNCVLKIDFGTKYPAIFLLMFAGTCFGIMFGITIGAIPKLGEGIKVGILTGVGLGLCSMSDLMVHGIKHAIERTVPIVNDLNPAALIVDSFYALNIYDTYERFAINILTLFGLTIVCGMISFIMIRRSRYASL